MVWALVSACSAPRLDPVKARTDAQWMLEVYVAALQEQHRSRHGQFAAHFTSLMDPGARVTSNYLARARPPIEVEIISGDADGWSAKATHPEFPGCLCVLTVGNPQSRLGIPTARGVELGESGQVFCRGFAGAGAWDT